jgi:hypothetical protein
MRNAALSLIASLALTATALPASAAPTIAKAGGASMTSNIITVSGGCGPAFYRDPWGYCVPNYYGYAAAYAYPTAYAYPGWSGYPYYAVRHHHRHHHRHH